MRLALGTRFLFASAGLVGLFFSAATPVHAGPATERMREFFGTVNTILNDPATRSRPLERVARVKRLVTDIADVRGAAAAALEHEWDVRTPPSGTSSPDSSPNCSSAVSSPVSPEPSTRSTAS